MGWDSASSRPCCSASANVASLATAAIAPASLPAGTLAGLAPLNNPLWGLAPIVERYFTIWVHIGSCMLIFLAASRRVSGWMWLAFLFKTALDSCAAYGQLVGISSLTFVWTLEAIVALFGVAGWLITRQVRAAYRDPDAATAPAAGLVEAGPTA